MEHYVTLIALTLALVAIPGPNVALIVAGSLEHGTRHGLATVAGTTFGVALQLFLIVLGYAALLTTMAELLTWIKWLGVFYLLYLGAKTFAARQEVSTDPDIPPAPLVQLFWRGALIASLNPKTLLFNAAFLPQFLSGNTSYAMEITLIAAIFLTTLSLGDALWALLAGRARPYLARFAHVTHRLSGAFLIAAGLGLALMRNK